MIRTRALTVVAIIVAALSTASLLAGLRHALRRERREPKLDPREAERRRIRAALGDLLAPPIDYSVWPEHLRPGAGLPADRQSYLASLPPLDPPLSQTIRDERDESRY